MIEASIWRSVWIGIFTACVVLTSICVAQQTPSSGSVRLGATAMGGVTLHIANFSSLPELPSCCPQFRDGSGVGAGAMLWGEYPLLSSLSVGIRIGTASFGGILRALERKPVLVADTPTEAVIQHSLASRFHSMRWEGYIGIRASSILDVYIGAGTDLIQQADGDIREELVQPARGTFENGLRERNTRSATLASTVRSMASLITGMRFSIPLDASKRWSLVPELSFRYALDPIARDQQWYIYSVLVGVGLAFEPLPLPTLPPSESLPEPTSTPSLPLGASIVAYGIESDREHLPLRIEEHRRWRVLPLLPVLYTDGGTSIPDRYIVPASAEDTVWRSTLSSPLGAYYALLPIIATRLRQSDDTLTIVGIDKQSAAQARRRSDYIARYFQAIWKIPPERLRILSRVDERDTASRVQFEGNSSLLGPIEHLDTVRSIVPALLRLRPATNGAEPLKQWTIRLWQDSTDLALRSGTGGLPLRIDVELAQHSERLRTDLPLRVRLDVESTSGNRVWAEEQIPIETSPLSRAADGEHTATVEYFLFSTGHLTTEQAERLATRYRHRLRDVAIVLYGNSLELDDALRRTVSVLRQAGFPDPRIERHEALYRPFTPERARYSTMIAVQIRYLDR
ncbi:MAG: hypothetical protein N3B17_04480 [Chlorobi bacterium]|nr:hypothetical protein [Chlorobiota bacterium]